MKKTTLILFLAFVMAFSAAMPAMAEGRRFVSITDSSTNTSAINMNNGAKAVFEENGDELTVQYYEANVGTMVTMIENAVIAGYDGMILQTTNTEAGVEAVQSAVDAGMVICEYDGDYEQIEGIAYFFGGDNYNIGRTCGEAAGKWAQENLVSKGIDVVVGDIEYLELPSFVERANGIKEGFMATCPTAKFVMEGFEWTTVECMDMVENWLQSYPEMNVVVGFADTMALGAEQAFAAAGKDPELTAVFGVDCIQEALVKIADPEGMYKGTVNLDLGKTGSIMAQFIEDRLNGVVVEGRGRTNYFPMVLVTAENVDQYM